MRARNVIVIGFAWVVSAIVVSVGADPADKSIAAGSQEKTAAASQKTSASCCCDNACGQAAGAGVEQRAGRGRGMGRGMGMGMGGENGAGPGTGVGAARGGGMAGVMQAFHQLLTDHAKINRTVEDVPNGVITVTTSDDPVVAATIHTHVRQMKRRLEAGQPLRMWDPLFVELFRHHDQIQMEIVDVPGGVKVTETSQDTHVVPLIRQHARRGVSEFVARGWARAHEPTPLPGGYAD